MLRFAKKDVRSIYTVIDDDGSDIAPLRSVGLWAGATTTVDGRAVAIAGDTRWRKTLSIDGDVVASARTPEDRGGGHRYEVEGAGSSFVLQVVHRRRWDALVGGDVIGSVRLVGWAGRRIEADLHSSLPLGVRLLAAFVAIRAWNIQAHDAGL